jgi:hypothetical protein
MKQYRQGDVLLELVEEIPTTKKVKERLLVRGEGRDHGHFAMGDVDVYEGNEDVEYYLDVLKGTLEHLKISTKTSTDEHHTIELPKGKYEVIRQVEHNPYKKEIQKVQD